MALRLRSCALLAVGALGLHQLRYSLAYGGHAGHALRAQGHAYVGAVTAAAVAALILALALGLHRLASGADRGRSAARGRASSALRARSAAHPLARLWAAAAGALLTIYAAQESLEGALAPGHPGGVAALTAHGGWIAIPLAAALGLLVALALRGARAVAESLTAVARGLSRAAAALRAPLGFTPPSGPSRRRLPVLAASAAGRAPPLAS